MGRAPPFSKEEIKRTKKLLDEQFEREKEEAACDGMITCLWSGRHVCFCKCGPHLCCPEHNLNCTEFPQGARSASQALDVVALQFCGGCVERYLGG
jgi:hypothetical protein